MSAGPRGSRAPRVEAAEAAGADRRRGVGRGAPGPSRSACTRGRSRSLTDAGGRGLGIRVFLGRPGRATRTAPTSRDAGVRALAEAAHAGAAVADPDEHAGLPDAFGATAVDGLALARDRRLDAPSARSSSRSRWSARRAAREGVSQVERRVYADSRGRAAIANSRGFAASYEATSAWAYSSAFAGEGADLMTGLGVGLARDPGGARPGGDRRRGRRPRARARRRAPAGEPPLSRWSSTRSSRRASPASSAGCCRPTPSSAAARCSPGKLGEEVAAPALRLADDGRPTPAAWRARRSTARARRRGGTPLIEGGRLATLSVRRAHRAQGRARDHRQRQPLVLPLAARRSGRPTS